jgi:hypothetical protein
LFDNFDPTTHGRPKLFGDDTLLGDILPTPLARKFSSINSLAGFLGPHLLGLSPDHDAAISLVAQDVPNRRRAPAPRDSSLLRLRREDSLIVEVNGDALLEPTCKRFEAWGVNDVEPTNAVQCQRAPGFLDEREKAIHH